MLHEAHSHQCIQLKCIGELVTGAGKSVSWCDRLDFLAVRAFKGLEMGECWSTSVVKLLRGLWAAAGMDVQHQYKGFVRNGFGDIMSVQMSSCKTSFGGIGCEERCRIFLKRLKCWLVSSWKDWRSFSSLLKMPSFLSCSWVIACTH